MTLLFNYWTGLKKRRTYSEILKFLILFSSVFDVYVQQVILSNNV